MNTELIKVLEELKEWNSIFSDGHALRVDAELDRLIKLYGEKK